MVVPKNKKIVLFDGICNLCESSVKLIAKNDKKDVFRLVSIQSEKGQEIINYLGIDTSKIDSIILYEPTIAYYFKAEAILKIAQHLSGGYALFYPFILLPDFIKNTAYNFIAKNRYKWYGKKEACLIPTPELKKKFLN